MVSTQSVGGIVVADVVGGSGVNPPPQPQHMSPIVKSASSKFGEHSSGFAL